MDFVTRRMIADPATIAAIKAHALAEYPKESCGAITPEGYVPLLNLSPDPLHYFECNEAIVDLGDRLLSLVHSHPDGPEGPSEWDMRQQIAMDIPWGLLCTDGKGVTEPFFWSDDFEPPPLEGRGFRHGPSGTDGRGDCYALIRDYYRIERHIDLPPGPRSDRWWEQPGGDLYAENYEMAGFKLADRKYPQIGDVGLLQIGRCKVPQHGCIYIGDGRILHHLDHQISCQDSFINWVKHLRGWIRHGG